MPGEGERRGRVPRSGDNRGGRARADDGRRRVSRGTDGHSHERNNAASRAASSRRGGSGGDPASRASVRSAPSARGRSGAGQGGVKSPGQSGGRDARGRGRSASSPSSRTSGSTSAARTRQSDPESRRARSAPSRSQADAPRGARPKGPRRDEPRTGRGASTTARRGAPSRGSPRSETRERRESGQGGRPPRRTADDRGRRSPATERTSRSDRGRAPRRTPEKPRGGGVPRSWGGVARRGAHVLGEDASAADSRERARTERPRGRPSREATGWVFERDRGTPAPRPKTPAATGARRRDVSATPGERLPSGIVDEISAAVGRARAVRISERLATAADAYARDRYTEAARITRPLAQEVPESPATRELHGLVCYRLGRWREAITHLEAARRLTGGDPDQIPVIMDCHRALGHRRRVEALWEELRVASPPSDVLVEGRLVRAETMADSEDVQDAIALLVAAGAARN